MARRRYQRGQLCLRGTKEKVWVARWREDVIRPDGTLHRKRISEIIGSQLEYKTRRLAERALAERLSDVNSITYRPRPTATFREFAKKWQKDVLTQMKPSTETADRSRITKHLIPEWGDLCLKDINSQRVQAMLARKRFDLSPKSIRNLIATVRMMWTQAQAWGYIQHDALFGIVLPDRGTGERAILFARRNEATDRRGHRALQDILLDSCGDGCTCRRSRCTSGAQSPARPGADQDHAKRVARQDSDCEIAQGQPDLRDQSATGGTSSLVPAHLAAEWTGLAVRHEMRDAVGYRHNKESQAVPDTGQAPDTAVWLPRIPSRQRDRHGSGECTDGGPSIPARTLGHAHEHDVHACRFRRWKAVRCETRTVAGSNQHDCGHVGGISMNFGPNWTQLGGGMSASC